MPTANETPWVEGKTIDQVFRETVRQFPDQLAAVFCEPGWQKSWRELDREVDRAARGLMAMGLGKGDHVAVWATNVPEWLVLQFATARIGAVLVAINPACRAHELAYALKQSDAKALFLIDRFKSSNYLSLLRQACSLTETTAEKDFDCGAFPLLRSVVVLRGEVPEWACSEADFLHRGKAADLPPTDLAAHHLSPEDPINIQFTSGTTGLPKATMLSHRNLLMNAFYVGTRQKLTSRDRICVPVPFYHCFGCVLGSLCSAVHGAAMIIPAEFFNARKTLEAVAQHQATALYGVPTMFIAELQEWERSLPNTDSLRTGIMAGAPCPMELMEQVMERFGARELTIAYGLTEASPVLTQTCTDDPIRLRVETVGQALPGVELRIIDPRTGDELPNGQQGELCSRGHGTMIGYYNDPEATANAIDSNGWLHSGDLATRDADGYVRITGRIKEMVIRGGENIFPREIESFLFAHPEIEDAAVVGVPDEKYGEELCAWIKPVPGTRLTADQVRDYCRQHISHQKVPRYIRLVDEFPLTVTGKIQKFRIRDAMIRELGLAPSPKPSPVSCSSVIPPCQN